MRDASFSSSAAGSSSSNNTVVFGALVYKNGNWRSKYKRFLRLHNDATVDTLILDSSQVTKKWKLRSIEILPATSPSAAAASATLHNAGASAANSQQTTDFNLYFHREKTPVLFTAIHYDQCCALIERFNEIMFRIGLIDPVKIFEVKLLDFSLFLTNVKLIICKHGLVIVNSDNHHQKKTFFMSQIKSLGTIQDADMAVVVLNKQLKIIFETSFFNQIIETIRLIKLELYNKHMNVQRFTHNDIINDHLGNFSDIQCLISLSEIHCQIFASGNKYNASENLNTILCITYACIIERDPSTYNMRSIYDLNDVFLLVRDPKNVQKFTIEMKNGLRLNYLTVNRDMFLSSIIDAARGVGNMQCTISSFSFSAYRTNLYAFPIDNEAEMNFINSIASLKISSMDNYETTLLNFISNIPYDGNIDNKENSLFQTNKSKVIMSAITAILCCTPALRNMNNFTIELTFLALKRLLSTVRGYSNFTKPEYKGNIKSFITFISFGIKYDDDYINFVAFDCLSSLIQPNTLEIDLTTEQRNKQEILSDSNWQGVFTSSLSKNLGKNTQTLLISGIVEFLVFVIARPFSDTTPNTIFETLLMLICNKGRMLFKLFNYPSLSINKCASLIFRAIIEESSLELARKMQELSVYEGTVLKHLYQSLFDVSKDVRVKVNRQVSRELLTLWLSDNDKAMSVIKNVFPSGLLAFLFSQDKPPIETEDYGERNTVSNYMASRKASYNKVKSTLNILENKVSNYMKRHWQVDIRERLKIKDSQSSSTSNSGKNASNSNSVILRKKKSLIKSSNLNWDLLFYQFTQDHFKPNLVWNQTTRNELNETLESQVKQFESDKQLNPSIGISWNYKEFTVNYLSLTKEIRVGDYFLRPLILYSDSMSNEVKYDSKDDIEDPTKLFVELNHMYMVEKSVERRIELLKAMSFINSLNTGNDNSFRSIMYYFDRLEVTSLQEMIQILNLLNSLVGNESNSKEIINNHGIAILCGLLPLCHLEAEKIILPIQSDLLALNPAPSDSKQTEHLKVWHYSLKTNERHGPVNFKELIRLYRTKEIGNDCLIWAVGFGDWCKISDLPQFKYSVIQPDKGGQTRHQTTIIILRILEKINDFFPTKDEDNCILRPMPKIKSFFSSPQIISILVNLYLTNNPDIIDIASKIINNLAEDQMFVHNLMNSGLIYFMLMYSGSNIIEIIKFLRKNHLNEANSDFSYQNLQASVLYHILPEALIFYLTNNTPESFMKIFLSDTKSPQVIWNSSMRKWMINKLSAHVSEFLPILNENILSIYEYVPIIKIEYPQLDKELFCHGLYLKYLCLEKEKLSKQNFRFSNPIEFLRTLLKQWQDELLKEGNSAMYINACKVLELEPEALGVGSISHNLNEEELKNKYRMLSRKYHPDNPKTGNEAKFIEMQEAYAFICGKKYDSGPNPDYLHYYIQVQIILLQFHRAELSNYKYPGYNAILSSLSHDLKNIFAKKIFSTLVVDCIKLVEETLVCSQLNCLELIHVDALNTLIDVLRESANNLQHLDNYSSRTTEVEICISILNCLTVGGVYFEFVEVLYQNKIILQLIVQMMNLKNAPIKLSLALCECIASISCHIDIQQFFFSENVQLKLTKYLFDYDFTLYQKARSDEAKADVDIYDSNYYLENIKKIAALNSEQYLKNKLAHCSARSLCSIASKGKPNVLIIAVEYFNTLFTPYLGNLLLEGKSNEFLKMFNTSTEDANLIWNNKTRKELQDHLTTHSQSSSALNLYEVQSFTYKEHSKYLIINGIFIELYNLNPSTQISNPEDFLQKLIDMLLLVEDDDVMKKSMDQNAATSHSHTNTASNDLIDMTTSVTIPSAITVESSAKNEKISKALLNLITNNTSVTIKSREQCESLLKIIQHNIKNAVSVNIIQTLHLIFSTSTALDTLASYYCLGHLISIITTCMNLDSIDTLMQCLIMIEKVIGSTKMLGELFNKGLFIHLIYYFTKPNADFPTRRKILELISFSMKDKLIGPKITIFLPKLIPKIFVFAIEDACESCIGLFDRDHETPEMLWNQEIRQKTFDIMTKLHKSFIKKRNENSHEITLYLPDNFSINLDEMRNKSVTIAGVNLERYLQNPDYVLRKPDEFAISLTHEWSRLMEDLTKINDFSFDQQSSMPPSANPHHEKLELILKCFTNFFKVHSSTLSILPQTDTLGNIIKYSSIYDNEIHSRSAITLMECVAIDENCAKQLISNGCVAIINDILKLKHRMSLSCAIILKNFASQSLSDLANQVNKSNLPITILELLESADLPIENPAELKALLVEFLKKMCADTTDAGISINTMCNTKDIWRHFKEQDHSLYISNTNFDQPNVLPSAAKPKIAGYLMSGSNKKPLQFDALPPGS